MRRYKSIIGDRALYVRAAKAIERTREEEKVDEVFGKTM